MAILVGHGGFLGLGEEVTYGTAVAVTHWLRASSLGIQVEPDIQGVPNLGTYGDAFANHRDTYVAASNVGGSVEAVLSYDGGFGLLLKHAFGDVTDGGSGPSSYTHTYTLTRNGDATNPALTMEQTYGQSGPAARAQVFAGCKIGSFEFSWETGGVGMLKCDVIGKSTAGPAAPSSPTFASVSRSFFQHVGTFTFDSADIGSMTSLKIKADRKLSRTPVLGSVLTGEPVQDGFGEITVEVTRRVSGNDLLQDLQDLTQAAASVTVTDGTASLAFAFGKLQVTSVARTTTGVGIVSETVTFKALATASNLGMQAVLTNSEATAEATA